MHNSKILIFGRIGQVGWELRHKLACLGQITVVDFPEVDFTNPASIRSAVRAVNPAVWTARACRNPRVSYVPGWAQAPNIGRALVTMLRTVARLRDRAPRPWTGSWTEPSVQPMR